MSGIIDYLCNAFTPDRVATWKEATAGLVLKIRADEFAEPEIVRIPAPDGPIPCFVYRPKGARGPTPSRRPKFSLIRRLPR